MSSPQVTPASEQSGKAVDTVDELISAVGLFVDQDIESINSAKTKDELMEAHQAHSDHLVEVDTRNQQMSEDDKAITSSLISTYREGISKKFETRSFLLKVQALVSDPTMADKEPEAPLQEDSEHSKTQSPASTGLDFATHFSPPF